MDALADLESWRSLTGDWRVLGPALAATGLAACSKLLRPLASALTLPVGLLAFRKAALFLPVPGALSTADWVAFWSTGAFVYFWLLIAFTAVVIAVLAVVPLSKWSANEELMMVLFWGGVGHFAASVVLLPVDGWTHLSMPFVAHIAAAKVLLIQPSLPALAGAAVILHVVLAVSGRGLAHREMNKLLLVVALVAGLVQLCLQPSRLKHARESLSLTESRVSENASSDKPAKDEVRDFLGVWVARIGSIRDCGVNVVEGTFPTGCPDREIVKGLSPWASPQLPAPGTVLWIACGLAVLAVLIESAGRRDRTPGPAAPGSYEAAVCSWRSKRAWPHETAFPRLAWILASSTPISVITVGLAIHSRSGVALGVTAAGFCGVWVTAELFLLARTGFFDVQGAGSRLILSRDQRGNRRPGRLGLRALRRVPAASRMLDGMPPERRWAVLAAGGGMPRGLEAEFSANATWLTRIDLACADAGTAGAAAARSLPADLWPRAARRLIRSKHAETRLAGVRCRAIGADTLLRLCATDKSEEVRRAAWLRIAEETLTAGGASRLARSQHEDTRAAAGNSGKLAVEDLMRLAEDPSAAVRQAAWGPLLAVMQEVHAGRLARSRYPDVRCRAVQAEKLPRADLLSLYARDPDPAVRDAARSALGPPSVREAVRLSSSPFPDVRSRALDSGALPKNRLKDLCTDPDPHVRARAFTQVRQAITPADAARLSADSNIDVRLRAIGCGLLARERLRTMSQSDPDAEVRKVAWASYIVGATSDEVESLLASGGREVRSLTARLPALSARLRLQVCASDWQAEARRAAWESLLLPLSSGDAAMLAASAFGDSRLRAIEAGPLAREQLVALCASDCVFAVRCAAWGSLASELNPEEAESLSRSPYGDSRLNAVRSGLLPESRIGELRSDADGAVRAAARDLLAKRAAGGRVP